MSLCLVLLHNITICDGKADGSFTLHKDFSHAGFPSLYVANQCAIQTIPSAKHIPGEGLVHEIIVELYSGYSLAHKIAANSYTGHSLACYTVIFKLNITLEF